MQPSGFEICPKCGTKNELKCLFNTYYYADCARCGKIDTTKIMYRIQATKPNDKTMYTIKLINIGKGAGTVIEEVLGYGDSDTMNKIQALFKDNGGKGDVFANGWTTLYLDKNKKETKSFDPDGFKVRFTDFEGIQITR